MNRMSYIENLIDNFYIKHVPIPMKTKRCKMKQGCCLVTFCPLVPSWATTIHKFQGFEAGFDRNDQFQHLIIRQVTIEGDVYLDAITGEYYDDKKKHKQKTRLDIPKQKEGSKYSMKKL